VNELEAFAEPLAKRLERPPHFRVGGVVINHLDREVGVVQSGKCLKGRLHHLDGLVVRRDLDRHLPGVLQRRDLEGRVAAAEDVEHLERVRDGQDYRSGFEDQQHQRTEEPDGVVRQQ